MSKKKQWRVTTQEDYLSERNALDSILEDLKKQRADLGADLLGIKRKSIDKKIEETKADIQDLITARQEEMKRQANKSRGNKTWIIGLVAILAVSVLGYLAFFPKTESNTQEETPARSLEEMSEEVSSETGEIVAPEKPELKVHFVDVGQADAILVTCDGHSMLIDGGNVADSRLMYSYLEKQGVSSLDYIIATHPHEDHVGGLAGALNYATANTALAPMSDYDSEPFQNYIKYLDKQGVSITVPKEGDSFSLGSSNISVLASGYSMNDLNDSSIVLRLSLGNISFLFTGDASQIVEDHIINSGAALQTTVLKVGHHGGDKATGDAWLKAVAPDYAVISVGTGNTYGHPSASTLVKLKESGIALYRTDLQGTIVFTSDGETISVECEKNADADTFAVPQPETPSTKSNDTTSAGSSANASTSSNANESSSSAARSSDGTGSSTPIDFAGTGAVTGSGDSADDSQRSNTGESYNPQPPTGSGQEYWLNTNTMKFHYSYCASAKKIKSYNLQVVNATRDEVISWGYQPCKKCNP